MRTWTTQPGVPMLHVYQTKDRKVGHFCSILPCSILYVGDARFRTSATLQTGASLKRARSQCCSLAADALRWNQDGGQMVSGSTRLRDDDDDKWSRDLDNNPWNSTGRLKVVFSVSVFLIWKFLPNPVFFIYIIAKKHILLLNSLLRTYTFEDLFPKSTLLCELLSELQVTVRIKSFSVQLTALIRVLYSCEFVHRGHSVFNLRFVVQTQGFLREAFFKQKKNPTNKVLFQLVKTIESCKAPVLC